MNATQSEKLWIKGSNSGFRINVNLDEFESVEDANYFTKKLHTVLVERYQYVGDVLVTDQYSGFAAGKYFAGDLPDGWSQDDYEAILSQ